MLGRVNIVGHVRLQNDLKSLLVNYWLIYCKKHFFIQQNKTYQYIYKSILITRQTRFGIDLTSTEATLKLRSGDIIATLKQL